ncbi:hypothetical protein [Streptomyces glaucescens]|uniref:hypothetical protein n=1 Tax=Streptomyces glaucescens TaxID=1907 RepID=UPI00131DABFA|nr:hypothetical protein [Streptomyces glaucescens]
MTEIDAAVVDSNASSATIRATIFNKSGRTIATGGTVRLTAAPFGTGNFADATFGSIAPGGQETQLINWDLEQDDMGHSPYPTAARYFLSAEEGGACSGGTGENPEGIAGVRFSIFDPDWS